MKKILFLFLILLLTQTVFASRYQEYSDGTYSIVDTTIQGYSSNYSGGAIKINQTANLIIDNSIFYDNKTEYIVNPNDTNGGAIYNEGNLYFNTNNYSYFLNNTATEPAAGGGAIYNANNAQLYAIFENNKAPYGGAVYNTGTLEILADANGNFYNFSSNVSSTHTYSYDGKTYGGYGGAVYNSSSTTTGNRVLFHNNSSSLQGGAIYNVGENSIFNVGNNNLFYENHSSSGGAISVASGRVNISNDVIFTTNTANYGGAVFVSEQGLLISSSTNIYGYNTAGVGGAIYNNGRALIGAQDSNTSSAFVGNTAAVGGAITNDGGSIGFCDNILFSQNSAETIGGAFFNNKADNSVFYNESRFENNSAIAGGGAIANSSSTISFWKQVEFENNSANNAGGAIFNSNGSDSNIEFYSSATFTNNSVTGNTAVGGAIFNGKYSVIKFNKGATFTNNSATTLGGAIANAGTIDLCAYGNNIEFTGNTANGVSNAIYDECGTINLKTYNADIIFNDSIASADDTSILNIDCYGDKVILNEDMNGYTGFVNLNSGSLEIKEGKQFFDTSKFTIYGGTFTANANSLLKGFGNVSGIVYLTGGTNNSSITGDGKTVINGNVVNNSFLGNTILINENKQLETSASNLLQEIENKGNLILNAGNLDINSTIDGAGTLLISGDVTSYKTIKQSSVTISQKLTNYNKIETKEYVNNGTTINHSTISATDSFINSGTLTNSKLIETKNFIIEGNGTINNTGTIKTKLLNIAQNTEVNNSVLNNIEIQSYIDNEGSLIFENGTSSNIIKGTGNTIIKGNIINNGQISETNLEINNGKVLESNVSSLIRNKIENNGNLVLKGNASLLDNTNLIQGNGTTIIDGYVVNMSTISNKLTINEDKFLRSDADDITGNITNNGQLAFNYTGTNNNKINGTGTLFIEGVVSNNSNIEQDYARVFSDKELTNNSTIQINKFLLIDANSKIINNDELFISSGTNNGKIEKTINSAKTNIYGNFVNNGTIEQSSFYVQENGKVQNNNIISADIIGNYGNMETSATNITGWIKNNGTLLFNAGKTNNNQISGFGTLNIVTTDGFTNNNSIEQKIITISKNNVNNLNLANSQLSEQEKLNKFINNSTIFAENLNLQSVNLKLTNNGSLFVENLSVQNSEIDFANSILQEHNFKTITLYDNLNLSVDADLANKKMDTISANGFNGNGKINVKAINIVTDAKEENTEVIFTTSTVLKDKIISVNTISSKLFKYDVNYDNNTGNFNFLLTTKENPVIAESAIASSVGGFATQANVLGQAFASMDLQMSNRHQAKQKGVLYASASSSIFDMENKIERGLWIRPYAVNETIKFNDMNVDNTAIGTLAGLDFVTGENSLISFYLGYAGSNQKYEDIKINQTGYIIGATGMLVKEKWYAGLTANINFNKAESQNDYGTDNFDMNMYSVGAKAGYNFEMGKSWILEPNLTLMYGNVNSKEYETTQGAKIDSQSTSNIVVEPQVKAKLSLDNGWQPYGLLGYVANISDKAKVAVDETEFETDKVNGYVEYGAGVNKDFINTHWSCYLEATGRSGGRTGFAGNLGIKYKF